MRTLSDIDLNLLVVFQEVFEQKHVSAVARRLGVSQPTVSNCLARLRKTFGDELFVRTPMGMLPTPFAQSIAEPIENALASIRGVFVQEAGFDPGASARHFRIAMTDVGEIHFLPTIVECCTALAPSVQVSVVRLGAVDWHQQLASGELDLAVGALTEVPDSLFHRPLFSQNFVVMYRRGHPLAGRKIELADFRRARHLIVASMEGPYEQVNKRLEKAGVRLAEQYHVPHFTSVPYVLGATDIIVTVPERLAARAAGPFGLEYAPAPLRMPVLRTSMFWHRRFNGESGSQWLRGFIREKFVESGSATASVAPPRSAAGIPARR